MEIGLKSTLSNTCHYRTKNKDRNTAVSNIILEKIALRVIYKPIDINMDNTGAPLSGNKFMIGVFLWDLTSM